MPATVIDTPLKVQFSLPDASTFAVELHNLSNQKLATDLAYGLSQLVHPHGAIATRNTAQDYAGVLRKFVTTLADQHFTGGATDLTLAPVLAYWLEHSPQNERCTRLMLCAIDSRITPLDPKLRAHLYGRPVKPTPKSTPRRPYSPTEWDRLTSCCKDVIDSAWAQHRQMLTLAEGAAWTLEAEPSLQSLASIMFRNGPMTAESIESISGQKLRTGADGIHVSRERIRVARDALFPLIDVQIAYRLLLGIQSGVVPDGIDDLGLSDVTWAGDATVLLSYVKGRTSGEGLTLPKDAVRTLKQWLDHSAPLRQSCDETYREALWLSINTFYQPSRLLNTQPKSNVLIKFSEQHGLTDDAGAPLKIHRGRIRATYLNLMATRGWTGRVTLDPNHTPSIEGDHYLTAANPAQMEALNEVIVDGQTDLVRRSMTPTVLVDDLDANFFDKLPDAIAELVADAPAINELVSGDRDVFLAACADQLAGVWGPRGQPCPARPWVCLMCPLAVFLPRHAPNLLRLKEFFARQFRQMPTTQFVQIFGPYADRLDSEILPQYPSSVLAAAAREVQGSDEELPLRPEESTRC